MSDSYLEEARKSLRRIRSENISDIGQRARLGESFNFEETIPHLDSIKRLFLSIEEAYLTEIASQQHQIVRERADSLFHLIESVRNFDEKQSNISAARQAIIDSIKNSYQEYFNQLSPIIAFLASRARDFTKLEQDYRATVQAIKDQSAEVARYTESTKLEVTEILDEIRRTAAESGVSQQAYYFNEEAKKHDEEARNWRNITIIALVCVLIFGVLSMFLHKIELLRPSNTFDAVALGTSKIFVFVILSYLVFLAAKNFLSHKHNAIVNRHRLNALLTFNALVSAANSTENRDVILSYAASCIFSPQETGYARSSVPPDHSPSILQALPRISATPS